MENNIENTLASISQKIKRLKARNTKLENENAELRASVFDYLQQLDLYKKANEKAITSMHTREISEVSKIDKKILKKDIDKYILMIDKCIASMKVKI